MHYRTWSAAALAAAVALGSVTMFVRAADEAKPAAADAPKAETKAADAGEKKPGKQPAKLTKPWSGLTTLSEDQAAKIRAIHRKALDEINAIKAREQQEITALLTDAQKTELKALVEADNVAKKSTAKKATAKSGDAPAKETTAP